MSVRRRAIRERVHRDQKLKAGYDELKRIVEAIQAMCERKIAAGETNVTTEELSACFPEANDPQHDEQR